MLSGRSARFACGTNLIDDVSDCEPSRNGPSSLVSVGDLLTVHASGKEEDECDQRHEEESDVSVMNE